MKANPKSKPNLTRFNYESTGFKGWRVSVTRHGEVFTRYFSDRKHGSMKKSQEAAQKCLAAFVKALEDTPLVVSKRKGGGRSTGITEHVQVKKATGETRVSWIAAWPENGSRRILKFPAHKHGARKAKQLALAARKDAEERLGLNQVKSFKRDDVNRLRDILASL